jgi:hypothetical protein
VQCKNTKNFFSPCRGFEPAISKTFVSNSRQANVVCRQLGYPLGAVWNYYRSPFGDVTGNFTYDSVKCTGQESTLDECPHSNIPASYCYPQKGVGIICNPGGQFFSKIVANYRTTVGRHFF